MSLVGKIRPQLMSAETLTPQGMTVVVAAVGASAHLSGVSRHAANLVRCLLSRAEVSTVHFVVAPWQFDSLRSVLPFDDPRLRIHQVQVACNAVARNLWYYNRLPLLAALLQADIVHLSYPAPLNRAAFDCPVVVTLHDLYPYDIPANFGFPKMLFNRAILKQCLHAADAITCVSESTLLRLDVYAPGVAIQKAITIHNCVEPGPPMAAVSPLPSWEGEPFLLCVAQHRRNKNVVLAMQVFERLLQANDLSSNARLVIVGIEGPETARIHRFIRNSGLTSRITLLRGITDAELEWCYGHCELLLAPSIVEGFGLPIVEATLHHCRIVCSDIPAFREVGGSYCDYADLKLDPQQAFVKATRVALKSPKFRVGKTDSFSGIRVAEAYLRLYMRLHHASARSNSIGRGKQIPTFTRGQL
jgi:glycosyltransferase involved in cell wall biosynthesis